MPALPSPGAVLRIEFTVGDNASIEAGSRIFVAYTGGPPNTTDLNTLATDVANAWETDLAPSVTTDESLHGVTIRDLSSDTGAVGTWAGTKAGGASGTPLTANVCVVVNHAIARSYRGGRPRTYVRMGNSASLTGTNEWSNTAQGDFLTAWQGFVAAILAVSALSITLTNIVNVSWYKGFTVFTSPSGRSRNIPTLRETPTVDVITNSSIAPKVGSQRRRLNL